MIIIDCKWIAIRKQMDNSDLKIKNEDKGFYICEHSYREKTRIAVFYSITEESVSISHLMKYAGNIVISNNKGEIKTLKEEKLGELKPGVYYVYEFNDLMVLIKSELLGGEKMQENAVCLSAVC